MKIQKSDIEYIILQHFFDQNFNVERLAEYLNISISYLREIVCFQYGICPQKLIEKFRLEKSIHYINNQNKLYIVARNVGYANMRSFRRAFIKTFGLCPSKFRNNIQLKNSVP